MLLHKTVEGNDLGCSDTVIHLDSSMFNGTGQYALGYFYRCLSCLSVMVEIVFTNVSKALFH